MVMPTNFLSGAREAPPAPPAPKAQKQPDHCLKRFKSDRPVEYEKKNRHHHSYPLRL